MSFISWLPSTYLFQTSLLLSPVHSFIVHEKAYGFIISHPPQIHFSYTL